mmetsp:Transcript_52620/g.112572  ORF Transcript_52620/g.112572 Transcript_52620/m.112572 type:complete len:318 (+) Transcript_52620:386-1339(+)
MTATHPAVASEQPELTVGSHQAVGRHVEQSEGPDARALPCGDLRWRWGVVGAHVSVGVGEALAVALVDALRLSQAGEKGTGGRGGVLPVGRLAREEEARADWPGELVIVSATRIRRHVTVRSQGEGVLPPLADHRPTEEPLDLAAEGTAERLDGHVHHAFVGEAAPSDLGEEARRNTHERGHAMRPLEVPEEEELAAGLGVVGLGRLLVHEAAKEVDVLCPEAALELEHHFFDRAETEPLDGAALPLRQRRRELDRLGLEHSQGHRDEHGVRLEADAASLAEHSCTISAVLDLNYLPLQEYLGVSGEAVGDAREAAA